MRSSALVRNGVPVSHSRRAARLKASSVASPQDSPSPAWCTSSRITSVLTAVARAACSIGLPATCA